MAHEIAHLCAERHYVGSASSGRFATDRGIRPSYDRIPGAYAHARAGLAKTAWYAKYLRDQDVVGWVLDHADAKLFIERGEALLEQLRSEQALACDPASWNTAQTHIDQLEARLAEALCMRKEASRQLRLLGVSPKEQAQILAEIERRLDSNA